MYSSWPETEFLAGCKLGDELRKYGETVLRTSGRSLTPHHKTPGACGWHFQIWQPVRSMSAYMHMGQNRRLLADTRRVGAKPITKWGCPSPSIAVTVAARQSAVRNGAKRGNRE